MSEMRELILKNLQQEGHISGELLGKRLKISRTAVWKHINEIRKLGYEIQSSPKTGYTFKKSPDLLLPGEIKRGLNTQIMGKPVMHYNTVSSTQDIAAEMARRGAIEGTLVISETQEKGRGRKGRSWVSLPQGGIYLSLILRPNLMPSQVVQIPLIAGVALTKAIRETVSLQPMIKWPNDIVIGKKKVGGILTEMSSEIDGVNYVVLGIGLNVNMPTSLFDENISDIATSLIDECGKNTSRVKLVQNFLCEFELLYKKFLKDGFTSVRDEWKELNKTIGSRVMITGGITDIEGEAIDIDNDGFLLVRKKNGNINRIISGDVSLRIPTF
jgi:BirA family transcriptional regulator, biotin operon repressor / biotin---[acetyl-CoA-carboxylase] ligase